MRTPRWRPKGKGFRAVFDRGGAAMWLRRDNKTTITGVVYLSWGDTGRDGIWTFTCKPNAKILHEVYDKPRRVQWLENDPNHWGGTLISRVPVPKGPKRRSPKVRRPQKTNRRVNWNWLAQKYK